MSFLETALIGSILIAVIWAVRSFTLSRLPRRTFVVLWILAAIRLLVPIEISSPLSVYGLVERHEVVQEVWVSRGVPATHMETAAGDSVRAQAEQTAMQPVSAEDIWSTVWVGGAVLCGIAVTALYVSLGRRFSVSVPARFAAVQRWLEEHPLRRRLSVRVSDRIRAPLTYGVLRPVILLPASMDMENTKELDYILTHEYVHIRHFDILLKALFTAVCCAYWWNPLVWVMYVLANRDIELACDESVVARCGGRADYARMLIQLEEQKIASVVPGISGSAGAAKERIRSIMKLKKKSVVTLVAAGALVAGVGTAFATNAPEAHPALYTTQQFQDVVIEAEDGAAAYDQGPDIVWWTADEYEAWLENEKKELPLLLGEKGWNGGGEFIWTQERIDEAIALYERILEDIRAGALVSKTVDGRDDVQIMQGAASEESLCEARDTLTHADIEEYAPFGLTVSGDGVPMYEGEPIRYFTDSVELDPSAPGMTASKLTYYSDEGTAWLRTVRRPLPNGDGSVDPFGELLGIERIPEDEARMLREGIESHDHAVTVSSVTAEDVVTDADLAKYAPFGLSYNIGENGISMEYEGQPVHSLFDPATGTWYANNMHGFALGDDRVDLVAVYEDGRLAGLTIEPEQHVQPTTHVYTIQAEGATGATSEVTGTTFEEIFSRYAGFGLRFEKQQEPFQGARYNLFWNGKPVNHFADDGPASVFTFESADQVPDGISVHVIYDKNTPVGLAEG